MTIDPSILLNAMCEVDVLLVFTCLLPFTIVTGQCHVSQTCQTCGISCIPGDVLFLVRIADTRRKIINTALMSRIFLVIERVGQPVLALSYLWSLLLRKHWARKETLQTCLVYLNLTHTRYDRSWADLYQK